MPLPLLMLGAAGLLGGGEYLIHKASEAQKKSDQEKGMGLLQQYFGPQGPGALYEQQNPGAAMGAMTQLMAGGNLADIIKGMETSRIGETHRAEDQGIAAANREQDRADALRREQTGNEHWGAEYAQRAQAQAMQQEAVNRQIAQQGAQLRSDMIGRTLHGQEQLQGDYDKAMAVHTNMQQIYQQFQAALQGGNNATIQAAATKLANLADPGNMVRDEERGIWIGRGGAPNQMASALNDLAGSGPTPKTKQILGDVALRLYKPSHDAAMRLRETTAQRVRQYNEAWQTMIDPTQVFGGTGYDYGESLPALPEDVPPPPGARVIQEGDKSGFGERLYQSIFGGGGGSNAGAGGRW